MEKIELRKKDFITSILLIIFSVWMILYTLFTMPMKDSWGGVMNVWYVSPGLFPLFIGILLIVMGTILGLNAIREGGAQKFFYDLSNRKRDSSGTTLRLLGILLVLFAYVYLNIPRIDFFLSTLFCLMVFISFFYLESHGLLKKLFILYLLGNLFFLVLFLAGVDIKLKESFPYSMDILVFLFFLSYLLYCRYLIRGNETLRKKLRIALIMSVVPSLVLVPSFKYLLLVPFPIEGAFIEMMNILRYSLR